MTLRVLSRSAAGNSRLSFPPIRCNNADSNPMFLEKRVYQGSSGKVYPNPFTDRVALEKVDASYRAIYLENEFIQLMILPEIGGRIHAGLDKTNQYDFFYRQNVIKPALVGLLGPWISGGVEFNWPQHHRPSTYMPVHSAIEQAADGSCTVWLSEHDPMERMKGMVGICLRPGCALVEAKVRLYNRTPLAQTFLWWANVARAGARTNTGRSFRPTSPLLPITPGEPSLRIPSRATNTTASVTGPAPTSPGTRIFRCPLHIW